MANLLVPNYMDIDFNTMKARLQDLLEANEVFKDYNYEGSNITLLIELTSYLAALTTYYGNKIAQNQYIDTAELYETVHMLARLRGYNPKGYISAYGTLTISLDTTAGVQAGDSVTVYQWKQIECEDPLAVDEDGVAIKYANVYETTETIPTTASFPYVFTVPIRQGEVITYDYTGDDIIDYKIYLPNYKYDYDNNIDDDYPSLELAVNNIVWTRLSDFYDTIDGLQDLTTTYMFKYDKYQRYYIEFSSLRTVPEKTDVINITLLKTIGVGSNVAANAITKPEDDFVYNNTAPRQGYLDNTYITVTNPTATSGEADPETTDDIKEASLAMTHSQYRNVTKNDYISHLELREDVVAANVWGEQEIAPSGSFAEYNKVYISVIPVGDPEDWPTSNITTTTSAGYYYPTAYDSDWKIALATYIEPYKMISAWEEFVLPELVYFNYIIGIRVKRTYNFDTVQADVINKLIYYFRNSNQNFGSIISFTDVINYILDTSYVDTVNSNNFDYIKGIQTLVIRDVNVGTHSVYELNTIGNYPYYTTAQTAGYDNNLRHIQLGYNQFPVLDITNTTCVEET